MRELYQWAAKQSNLYARASNIPLFDRLRQIFTPHTSPVLRALTLTLGVLTLTSMSQLQAQFTLVNVDPTCQNKTNGSITLENLTPGTMYMVNITSTGTIINSATYTANASGQIVFSSLAQGTYTFDVAGQSPQTQTITLYDVSAPISATSTVACTGARSWVNPFHNDEVSVSFPFNTSMNGTSKNTNYLGDGTTVIGSSLTDGGMPTGCVGNGKLLTNWNTGVDHATAYAGGDYLEIIVPVTSLKYDLTNLQFLLRTDANGPANGQYISMTYL